MPEFYEAVFGNGHGSGMATGGGSSVAGHAVSQALGGEGVGVGSVTAGGDEMGGDTAVGLGMDAAFDGGLGHVPTDDEHGTGVGMMGEVVVGARAEEFSGVALQERLVRLREAFAQEECRKLFQGIIGL